MKSMIKGKHIAAIDIGTTKICVLIAGLDSQGALEILGMGQYPSYGLKKGVIVNVGTTVESIRNAVAEAEQSAGLPVAAAVVGISGGHVTSFNASGVVAIKQRDVTQEDIDRVMDVACAVPLSEDRQILHVIPQFFRVDGQERVLDSLGMYGVRLEAQVHIVTGAVASAQNIIKACELAGVEVADIVLEQIASALAVLTPSEKELGVGILDIGGGTSDFAIYKHDKIMHSKVVPIAGNHFTNDLAIGLGIPVSVAEHVKRDHGFVLEEKYLESASDSISVPLELEGQRKTVDMYTLYEILNPRAKEIFDILSDELTTYRLRGFMPSGFVLTGGGTLLNGMRELAIEQFKMPVRIGVPRSQQDDHSNVGVPDILKSPIYSTGYGLLLHAALGTRSQFAVHDQDTAFARVLKKMKSWIYDFL